VEGAVGAVGVMIAVNLTLGGIRFLALQQWYGVRPEIGLTGRIDPGGLSDPRSFALPAGICCQRPLLVRCRVVDRDGVGAWTDLSLRRVR
jgi:hypothetical protein